MNAWETWLAHLQECDQCKHNRPCIVCEGGLGWNEVFMTDDEIYECHACHCPQGPGLGAELEENAKWERIQKG